MCADSASGALSTHLGTPTRRGRRDGPGRPPEGASSTPWPTASRSASAPHTSESDTTRATCRRGPRDAGSLSCADPGALLTLDASVAIGSVHARRGRQRGRDGRWRPVRRPSVAHWTRVLTSCSREPDCAWSDRRKPRAKCSGSLSALRNCSGPCFECAPHTKEPFARLAPHGCYSGTRDPETIRSWSARLDTESRARVRRRIVRTRRRSAQRRRRGTCAVRTRARAAPTDAAPNHGGATGCTTFCALRPVLAFAMVPSPPGSRSKADGGYIVIAPSVHPSGRPYRWDPGALPSRRPSRRRLRGCSTSHASASGASTGRATGPAAESFCRHRVRRGADARPQDRSTRRDGGTLSVAFAEHSDGRGDGRDLSTVVLPATEATKLGAFRCAHAHCSTRRTRTAVAAPPTSALVAAARALPDLAPLAVRWVDEPGDTRP